MHLIKFWWKVWFILEHAFVSFLLVSWTHLSSSFHVLLCVLICFHVQRTLVRTTAYVPKNFAVRTNLLLSRTPTCSCMKAKNMKALLHHPPPALKTHTHTFTFPPASHLDIFEKQFTTICGKLLCWIQHLIKCDSWQMQLLLHVTLCGIK